jgi:hypothetical protein
LIALLDAWLGQRGSRSVVAEIPSDSNSRDGALRLSSDRELLANGDERFVSTANVMRSVTAER